MESKITDDLDVLLSVLPPKIEAAVRNPGRENDLLEVILDLGRRPGVRYTDGELILSETPVTKDDIEYVKTRVSEFDDDNRAGIERTLHRISAIRNRRGDVIGLTCRVGRAVYGTIDIILDIIEEGQSVLLLGRPGVGKTTMLREAARVLADKKRVIVVDTSNEIGGDGDVPHPAVGRARRMQVSMPTLQHEVMIEAVENHNPETIVIDEIGRELEATAARTIAERGVQLIGTAHGNSLDNLMLNPTLSDLIGGIESVTLGDDEARRRGTQKTVLERRAPPTFDALIEIQDRQRLLVHHSVADSVDALLRGREPQTELRYRDESGEIQVQAQRAMPATGKAGRKTSPGANDFAPERTRDRRLSTLRAYPYGVARNRLREAARRIRLPVMIVDSMEEADALITARSYYRRRPQVIVDAEKKGVPIHVLRSNTVHSMEGVLADLFNLADNEIEPLAVALRETQEAIRRIQSGARSIDLSPQNAYIRRHQHKAIREARLISHSYGKEPRRRVRIYRE
ncbi:MAG: R3H domain-containing nucleic acid-binding protein [Anaerolineae bacterium]|jgi:stage III sporulation protein SpoIIIAA